jgi:hypothetical protein
VTGQEAVLEQASRLADIVQLEDVIYFETSAKRLEPESAVVPEVPAAAEIPIQVKIGQSEGLERLLIRMMAEVASPQATFRVDVGAQFVLTEALEASSEVQVAFASHTAMAILMPYLRESLMTMASRMRVPAPLLPLVQPSHLTAESVTITE